jgi:hypothetical protein
MFMWNMVLNFVLVVTGEPFADNGRKTAEGRSLAPVSDLRSGRVLLWL